MSRNGLITAIMIGRGAREHALSEYIRRSPLVRRVFCLPGNAGTPKRYRRKIGESELGKIAAFAKRVRADLIVIGPEKPLVAGAADIFTEMGFRVFGPSQKGARLEGNRVFTKLLCTNARIPQAPWDAAYTFREAKRKIELWGTEPPVVKANLLGEGKGAFVPDTPDDAVAAAHTILVEHALGLQDAVTIEQRLVGRELSLFVLTDGANFVLLPQARDYKRALEGDEGLNTGGMGAYSPVPDISDELIDQIVDEIIDPTLQALRKDKVMYRGVLYAGIMVTDTGPKLLEYNVRFGDPEIQTILPRLGFDIVPYLIDCANGDMTDLAESLSRPIDPRTTVCITLASEGYPGTYETEEHITGLQRAKRYNVEIFHAGTERRSDGKLYTAGGRVFSIVGKGITIQAAREQALLAAEAIEYEGKMYRTDIAYGV